MRSKAGGRLRFIEFQQPTLVEDPPEASFPGKLQAMRAPAGPYDITAATGHAGIVDEALLQKSESDRVAVSDPHAMTPKRVAPRAPAMMDEDMLRIGGGLLPRRTFYPISVTA